MEIEHEKRKHSEKSLDIDFNIIDIANHQDHSGKGEHKQHDHVGTANDGKSAGKGKSANKGNKSIGIKGKGKSSKGKSITKNTEEIKKESWLISNAKRYLN